MALSPPVQAPPAATARTGASAWAPVVVTRPLQEVLVQTGGLVAIVAVAVGLPLWSAFATGAIDVPKNDDWAFSRIAIDFARTGEFRLVGWGVMAMVGHILWAQPWIALFGEDLRVLHLVNAATSAAGLGLTFAFARCYLRPARALLVTAVVAAAPAYALMSTTFMTDPTAYIGQIACLLLGVLALRRGSGVTGGSSTGAATAVLLVASLAAGLFAFTVREVAIVAPIAVIAGYAWQIRRRGVQWSGPVIAAATVIGAAVAFTLWRRGLPADQVLIGAGPPIVAPMFAARAWFTTAFVLGPVVMLVGLGMTVRRRGIVVAIAVIDVLIAGLAVIGRDLAVDLEHPLFTGSFFTRHGSMGSSVAVGTRPLLYPTLVWTVIVLAALVAGVALAVRIVTGIRGRSRWRAGGERLAPERVVLGIFVVGAALSANAYAFVGGPLYDRYLWPAVLGAGILLLSRPGPLMPVPVWRRVMAAVWLVALVTVSLLGTVEEHTFDVARWEAGEKAVKAGLDPSQVDAGFEWVGWHYDGAAFGPGDLKISAPHRPYLLFFAGVGNCEFVASSKLVEPGVRIVRVLEYQPAPFLGERRLYTYRNDFACGLTPPPRKGLG